MTLGTVLVVDDHDLVAASLTYALSGHGFDAHRLPVSDLETVKAAAEDLIPAWPGPAGPGWSAPMGVVLLDLDLGTGPDGRALDGVDLVAPLRAQGWLVLVLTGTSELDRVAAAVVAGAADWVVKGADLTELVAATVALAQGGGMSEAERRTMLERHQAAQQAAAAVDRRLARLTAKEREVLDQLAAGTSAAQIAQQSYTSIRTVRAHIRSILTKLDVNSQGAATAIAHTARQNPTAISAAVWRESRVRPTPGVRLVPVDRPG
ncbi:LuxR C-terminal-related transcriptional regulator [Microlunatus elymi]|uniref:LuxR C-terminal-related transcriptional regulator n=1 Tax=Microlunatus elymi TaxID=2596828 RepID=UPI00143E0D15|nr:response regulator transcription factor [Microlunatus elymi]